MTEDIFVKPIPTQKVIFEPVGRCIYCGSEEGLQDEHIVPNALNGTMILQKSSCSACARITSRFELNITLARYGRATMYGVLRNKRGYQTYNKNSRPRQLPMSYSISDGTIRSIDLEIDDYPCIYPVVFLPPPGILTGSPLSDKNPEGIRLELRASDPNELKRASSSIGIDNITLSMTYIFPYGDFYRLLAKIAHGFLVAYYGQEGYFPFLPDLILGRSPYLSHYVGGLSDGEIHLMSHHVSMVCLPTEQAIYLSVNIHLLGGLSMQTYQVIAAEVTDFKLLNDRIHSKNGN